SEFRSGNATSAPSSTNTTNPNDAVGPPDASDFSNNLCAKISNILGANVVLDLTDSLYAGDTVVVKMAPDNNSANTIRVEGNLTNNWASPTTSTDFNLPVGTNKVFANYNFVLSATTRFIRIIQIGTTH